MRAFLCIRHPNTPRHRAFCDGLATLGYEVSIGFNAKLAGPDDVLVVWNRHGELNGYATAATVRGCPVVVAENGYIGQMGETFALALDHHNGAGRWYVGQQARGLGVEPTTWRADGDYILVLPQRGIGEPGIAQPRDWKTSVTGRLRSLTRRRIVVREHPGRHRNDLDLAAQIKGAWAVVTWGSGAAVKALMAGVPVFHEMPKWIGAPAARLGVGDLERPFLGDRSEMLHRLSWAQWTIGEVRSGEPFRHLLRLRAQG